MKTNFAQPGLLEFFQGFANGNRQKILFLVFTDKKAHTVGEVASRVGLAQSTTSAHLNQMKRAGILVSEKQNKEVYYSVNKSRISDFLKIIENWLSCC